MVLGNVISGFLFQTAAADPVVLTAIGLLFGSAQPRWRVISPPGVRPRVDPK